MKRGKNHLELARRRIGCYTCRMAQQTAELVILGQRVTVRSSDIDPEIFEEALRLASAKIGEAEKRGQVAVPYQVVVVALLDLAEEYVKSKRRVLELKEKWNEKSSRLLNLIESNF